MYESANDYITKESEFLKRWCKTWTKKDDTWGDLLSHFYLYLNEDWEKFNKIPDEDKPKWVQAWLKNTVRWDNNPYKRDIVVNNLEEFFDIPHIPEEEYLEIDAEDCDDFTKDWIKDLHRNYSDRQVDLLLKVRLIYIKNLTVRERVLYDLIYTKQMSLREVSNKTRIPTTVVFHAVKNLNNKIKELCGN